MKLCRTEFTLLLLGATLTLPHQWSLPQSPKMPTSRSLHPCEPGWQDQSLMGSLHHTAANLLDTFLLAFFLYMPVEPLQQPSRSLLRPSRHQSQPRNLTGPSAERLLRLSPYAECLTRSHKAYLKVRQPPSLHTLPAWPGNPPQRCGAASNTYNIRNTVACLSPAAISPSRETPSCAPDADATYSSCQAIKLSYLNCPVAAVSIDHDVI